MSVPPTAVDPYAAQASPTRRHALALLRDAASPQDAQQLAAALALHVSTVRFHLRILEQAGLVSSRSDPRGSAGRPRTVYTAVPVTRGEGGPSPYEEIVRVLAAHLDETEDRRSARAEEAGASWAARLTRSRPSPNGTATSMDAAVEHLIGVFADMGFDPELTGAGDRRDIRLRACPFRAVAREHPDVVCAIHRGLLRAVLAHAGAPPVTAELLPFVEPELCVAQVARLA